MIKLLKRVVMFASAFVLMLSATGCGDLLGDGGNGNKDTKTLKIWIQSVNQPQYFMTWFKTEFESKNPGIKLEFQPQSVSVLQTGLDVALAGREAPDMASTWGGEILPGLVAGNRVAELDILDKHEEDMINQSLLNKIDGKHYGAPIFGFASPVIYYNKTVFDSNPNLNVPETYAEMVTLCNNIRAIQAGGVQRYQPLVTGLIYHFMQSVHARTMTTEQLNAIIEKKDETSVNPFDNEAFQNGWEWLEQMRNDNIFARNITGYTADQAMSEFTTQSALMLASPSLDLLTLSDSCQFEIGAFLLPEAPDAYALEGELSTKVSGVYTDVLTINARSQYIDECKKVIEFMYSDEAQAKLFDCFLFPVKKNISYANVNANIKNVFDSVIKPIYDEANANGMSLFYMSYFHKSGLNANLENSAKGILNNTKSAAEASAEIRLFW